MTKTAIIMPSENNYPMAQSIKNSIPGSQIYTKAYIDGTEHITSIDDSIKNLFNTTDSFVFIGAVGVCVRSFSLYMGAVKEKDPILVCVDNKGKYVVSIMLGHDNSGNMFAKRVAHIIGAEAIITTQNESENLWALETLGERFGWDVDTNSASFNYPQASFMNRRPTALLLDIQDEGTVYLERTLPDHVTLYYRYEDIDFQNYELLIAVTPYIYQDTGIQIIYYHPKVLHIGISCRSSEDAGSFPKYLIEQIRGMNFSLVSIKSISSADLKEDADLLNEFSSYFKTVHYSLYTEAELKEAEDDDSSSLNNDNNRDSLTIANIAEAAALKSAGNGEIVLNKQKAIMNKFSNDYNFAIALDRKAIRQGHVEIIGAGPGDPDLISIKGKYFIEAADLILYSEKQVDVSVTYGAKDGVEVRNLDSLSIKEQFELIADYYKKGKLIVRLNMGDSCIYGAIQELMIFFDEHKMSYHITPGISSFSAAAAALESQFTIPNLTETIILTRENSDSSLPNRQKLEALAQSQSTMCIFLSATMIDDVQRQLLTHYPPQTSVAVCYKITWKDERIYRGQLQNLSKIIKDNNLSLNTLIVVGDAIGNREGLSKLYEDRFNHLMKE